MDMQRRSITKPLTTSGQDTVEVDRPGAKTQENKSTKADFTKEKVHDACVSCGK